MSLVARELNWEVRFEFKDTCKMFERPTRVEALKVAELQRFVKLCVGSPKMVW